MLLYIKYLILAQNLKFEITTNNNKETTNLSAGRHDNKRKTKNNLNPMKVYILLITFFIICINSFSQKYFQQEVNFKINVKLNDKNHSLIADETIEYINNSPDTLNFIYFHLWPNAYKNNSTALAMQQIEYENKKLYFSTEKQRGYIDNLNFKINGNVAKWNYHEKYIDICKLELNKPLLPGKKIIITTPFYVKIPSSDFSRLGHAETSYQITQWYPKPAVYNNEGWHEMPYLDMGEFYSEFGSYEVAITLPENYIVGATGNLIDQNEIDRLNKITEETKDIKSYNEDDNAFPKSSEKFKTIHFKEDKIHDFAWFADKRFHVLKAEVILPHSGRKVNTWVFFTNYDANLWKNAIEYVSDAVYYYSKWYGDYPYNNCTAVEGALSAGGGMEYPTITIIGSSGSALSLEEVIMHEVGHNWFYGMLASNERDDPWMDEGMNTFSELRYMKTKYPNLKMYSSFMNGSIANSLDIYDLPHQAQFEIPYIFNARRNLDQPANLKSTDYLSMNYGVVVYMKAAFMFNYLMEYLGKDEFDRIMKIYFETWKYKHPKPRDVRKIFEDNCKKDLSWFFDDLLTTTKKIDYKISAIKKSLDPNSFIGDCYEITVKNKGDVKAPFSVSSMKKNGETINTLWIEGFEGKKKIKIHTIDFDKIKIGANGNILDVYKKNNTISRKGIFKKIEPIKIHFLGTLENPDKNQLFYTPVIGWNNYNGIMPGIMFYNSLAPMKKTEYRIMPMFGLYNTDLAGNIVLEHHILPVKTFQRIDIRLKAMQYALSRDINFQKLRAEIDFWIKSEPAKKKETHVIAKTIYATDIQNVTEDTASYKMFADISFTHLCNRKINPYSFNFNVQGSNGFAKSWIEGKYKLSYEDYRKGFNMRIFAGKFLYNAEEYYGNYNFRLSGWAGYQDYTYEHIFLGRTETPNSENFNKLLFNQFTMSDGGFAVYSPLGQSNNWLISANLKLDAPIPVPISVYSNIGFYAGMYDFDPSVPIIYESGLCINIINNIFEIYFPITMTKSLKQANEFYTDNYVQKIRFILNLNLLDPFKFAQNFRM